MSASRVSTFAARAVVSGALAKRLNAHFGRKGPLLASRYHVRELGLLELDDVPGAARPVRRRAA